MNYEPTIKPDLTNPSIPQSSTKQNKFFHSQWIVREKDFYILTDERIGSIKEFPQNVSLQAEPGRVLFCRWDFFLECDNHFFDPRYLLGSGTDLFGRNRDLFAEVCNYYVEMINGKWGEESKQHAFNKMYIKEKIDKAGHKVYFMKYIYTSVRSPNRFGPPDVVNITFDPTVGFNPTLVRRYYNRKLWHERTFAYKKIDGIFIPDKVNIKNFGKGDNGSQELYNHRELILVESKRNLPIDPGLFEVKSLNLKYGERMLDTVKKKAFVQEREGLIPAKDFEFKKNEASPLK